MHPRCRFMASRRRAHFPWISSASADRSTSSRPYLPCFGQSEMPALTISPTRSTQSRVIDRYREVIRLNRFAILCLRLCAPTGFRVEQVE